MINKILLSELEKTGKPLSWFKFAKKNQSGSYRFLSNKETQWQTLNQVAKKAAKKLPQYTLGQIVDALSQLINNH